MNKLSIEGLGKEITKHKKSNHTMDITKSLTISKGITSFKNLHLVTIINEDTLDKYYYFLQCNVIPNKKVFYSGEEYCKTDDYQFEAVSNDIYEDFSETLDYWSLESYKSHLNPYTYLYCILNTIFGINIHSMRSFNPHTS